MSSKNKAISAEDRFREAFERLKINKPIIISAGTPISQNSIAKEAGCDPSALRKARFPSLIREIQAYIEIHTVEIPSKRKEKLEHRNKLADLRARLEVVTAQRDIAQSQLLSAQTRVLELITESNSLKGKFSETHSPTLRR